MTESPEIFHPSTDPARMLPTDLATPHDKKLAKKQKETDKPKQDSMTNVHFSENHVYKYVSGDRKPIAIRIDSGLYSRFKPLAKRVYGSVCRAVEVYITAFISAVENGVHFSNTDKPINIEKIVIERNLRPRRKLPAGSGVTKDQLDYLPNAVKNWGNFPFEHKLTWFDIARAYPDWGGAKEILELGRKENLV